MTGRRMTCPPRSRCSADSDRRHRPDLTRNLLRYWSQRAPKRSLFDDPEHDLALLLHARAYGSLQDTELPDHLHEILAGYAADGAALLPVPLAWGPRAALSPSVRAALPSSLVQVWIFSDEHGPVEVLAVGQGLPEIQRQIQDAAFRASLCINGTTHCEVTDPVSDVLAVGLIRIGIYAHQNHDAASLPDLGEYAFGTIDSPAATALGALRDFVALLRTLERRTKLVRIVEVSRTDADAFQQELRTLPGKTSADTAAEKAVLLPMSGDGTSRAAASRDPAVLLPCLAVPSGPVLGLRLSPDLFATRRYRDLEAAHLRLTVDKLIIDAKLRRDHNRQEADRLQAEHDAFKAATQEERDARWGRRILLTQRFDHRLGMTRTLSEPEWCDTEEYYLLHVPGDRGLVGQHRTWAARMALLVVSLEQATLHPFSAARQLAHTRFADAALRGADPQESPGTAEAFQLWSQDVQPMLRFEWRSLLEHRRLAVRDVFSRHTVLVTRYDSSAGYVRLIAQPHSLVDAAFSTVLADPRRGVLVVRDATDYAIPLEVRDEQAARGVAHEMTTSGSAASVWSTLCERPNTGAVDQEEFADDILKALRDHPEIIREVTRQLQPAAPDPTEAAALQDEFSRAERAVATTTLLNRAFSALVCGAHITARECLDQAAATAAAAAARPTTAGSGDQDLGARVWLFRVVVECIAAGYTREEIMADLAVRSPNLPREAIHALDEADISDPGFTAKWLAACATGDLTGLIHRLFNQLPRAQQACRPSEYAALLFHQAIAGAQLARRLDECAAGIPDDFEARDQVLARVGEVLEEILVGPLPGSAGNDALNLLDVLSGEELPKYGQVN